MTSELAQLAYIPLSHPVRITKQVWPEGTVPLVSILCITYNHEKYIEECLEGFLMQETTFPVEIIVHDDASTDNTPRILRECSANHPSLFRLILQQENKLSQNIRPTPIAIAEAKGRYVAFCDGDDYWFDPLKLEQQVKKLEEMPEANLCFHRVRIEAVDGKILQFDELPEFALKPVYTIDDIMRGNFLPTSSVLAKRETVASTPDWFQYIVMNDWPRWILACENGPAITLDKIMGVYRTHNSGLWMSLDSISKFMADLDFFHLIEMFGPLQARVIAKHERRIRLSKLLNENTVLINENAVHINERFRISKHFLFGPTLRFWRRFVNRSFPSLD